MAASARTLTEKNAEELARWCGGRLVTEHDALDDTKTSPGINVPVGPFQNGRPEGVKRASVGDTITKTHDGVFNVVRNTN